MEMLVAQCARMHAEVKLERLQVAKPKSRALMLSAPITRYDRRLLSVPYWDWDKLSTDLEKSAYVKERIDAVMAEE